MMVVSAAFVQVPQGYGLTFVNFIVDNGAIYKD